MSWSFDVPPSNAKDFHKALSAAAALEAMRVAPDEEASEQITVAVEAATRLASSGAVGSATIAASLSGHANKDHKPRSGYSNDVITISVACGA